jgi:nitroreductase
MEFKEVIRRRHMVRRFTDEPLDEVVVERILRAGLRAPSAGYSQGYALLALQTAKERQRLWATHSPSTSPAGWSAEVRDGIKRAPLVVVVLASKEAYLDRYARPDKGWTDRDEARWPVPYWYVDAGCVALLLLLAAVDEGLGALFFGVAPEDVAAFKGAFSIPDGHEVVGCVALGHEDPDAPRRDLSSRRRPPEELIHRGRW